MQALVTSGFFSRCDIGLLLELWCLLYYVQSVICEPKDGIVVQRGTMVSTAITRGNSRYGG